MLVSEPSMKSECPFHFILHSLYLLSKGEVIMPGGQVTSAQTFDHLTWLSLCRRNLMEGKKGQIGRERSNSNFRSEFWKSQHFKNSLTKA